MAKTVTDEDTVVLPGDISWAIICLKLFRSGFWTNYWTENSPEEITIIGGLHEKNSGFLRGQPVDLVVLRNKRISVRRTGWSAAPEAGFTGMRILAPGMKNLSS